MKKLLAAALAALLLPACGDEGDTIVQGGPTPPPSGSLLMSTQNGLLLVVQPGSPPAILGGVGLVGISTVGSTTLRAIDHRVQDGLLYGVTDANAYRVDPLTGVCLQIATSGSSEGTAFDPLTGLLRVVGVTDENGTLDVTSNTLTFGIDLAYAAGDTNFGANPTIHTLAATNQVAGAASTTFYAIDRTLDVLVSIVPATGAMTTVGDLTVDVDGTFSPFDISAAGTAYVVDDNVLYTINLATGAMTLLGAIPTMDTVTGLAVVP